MKLQTEGKKGGGEPKDNRSYEGQKHVKYNPYSDVQLDFLDFVRNECRGFV